MLPRRDVQLPRIDRFENRMDIDCRTRILLHLISTSCRCDLRMTKGRQPPSQHLLSYPLSSLFKVPPLELLNEVCHVVNRTEVSRAIERHLPSDEQVDDREGVQRRHVSRHHTRSRRSVMDLNRAHAFENFSL